MGLFGGDEPIAGTVTTFRNLNFAQAITQRSLRVFQKIVARIINVRADGEQSYVFRRVQQGWQWKSYEPIEPV